MIVIKPIQERILAGLARYKFLTVSQMERLKVGHKNWTYIELRELEKGGFTKSVQYGVGTRSGVKTEKLHFLTPKGAKLYVESVKGLSLEQIKYPKSHNTIVKNDFAHRMSMINTQISFDHWTKENGFETIFFDTYFDTVGSNRNKEKGGALRPKTRLDFGGGNFADPDGILLYSTGSKKKLWVMEVFNGNDSGRVVKQLRNICYAILHGITADKYGVKLPERALITFEHEANMKASIERMKQDPYFDMEGIEDFFYFSLAEKTWGDFGGSWVRMDGKRVKLETV
jgi:hypothetical protein